jgi:hypothetical protein
MILTAVLEFDEMVKMYSVEILELDLLTSGIDMNDAMIYARTAILDIADAYGIDTTGVTIKVTQLDDLTLEINVSDDDLIARIQEKQWTYK